MPTKLINKIRTHRSLRSSKSAPNHAVIISKSQMQRVALLGLLSKGD